MDRFLALIWNPEDSRKTANARRLARGLQSSSSDWCCVLETDGLQVFGRGARVGAGESYRLWGNAGVVVGKLFRSSERGDETSSDVTFDATTSRTVIDTWGKHLADHYWGRYVAFLRDKSRRRHYVFRDPTGAVPCIFTDALGVSVFMSDLEDYIPLEAGELCINWNHIAAQFWNKRAITRETGFEKVSQVYSGECMVVENGAMAGSFHWEPARVYESGVIEDPEHAKKAIKHAVSSCVGAWASCYGSIIHMLSGGLDSSIVAACLSLASTRPDVVCVNLRPEAQEGDERYFAGLAARKAGFELIERQWRSSDRSLESLLDTRKHATPTMTTVFSETDRVLQRLTKERGTEAVFSGQGGDHLFQFKRNPRIAAEYVRQHGLQPELAKIVADTSRFTGKSVWNILGQALTYGLFKRRFDPYAIYEKCPLLSDDAVAALSPKAIVHPWAESADGLPPSKIEHIELIVDAQHFYLTPSQYSGVIHPLISQPVIERCLQIPTYVLIRGGVNRALVRNAFSDELPPEIAARISKGSTTNYLNRLLVENAGFVREYLLDGKLISERILNKQKVEDQLSEQALIRGSRLFDIFTAVRVETWLRTWAGVWCRAAA
jgi:asparagine synthase (glutamine-hydrolysing)